MNRQSKAGRPYVYMSQIATQNDKLMDAIAAFDEIINEMPRSEAAFQLAKAGLDARCRTERDINDDMAFIYLANKALGYDHDPRREIFELLPKVTLDDLEAFQKENVKGRVFKTSSDIDTTARKRLQIKPRAARQSRRAARNFLCLVMQHSPIKM